MPQTNSQSGSQVQHKKKINRDMKHEQGSSWATRDQIPKPMKDNCKAAN